MKNPEINNTQTESATKNNSQEIEKPDVQNIPGEPNSPGNLVLQDFSQTQNSKNAKLWVYLATALTAGLLLWFLASTWVLLFKGPLTSAAVFPPPKVEIIFSPIIQKMQNGPQGDVAFVYDTASMERQIQLWQPRINQAFGDAYENAMKDKTEAMQTRIGDTWSAVQGIGLISAVIGVLITVLVLYFSFANSDAINSAKGEMFDAAKKQVEKHLSDGEALKNALEATLEAALIKELKNSLEPAIKQILLNSPNLISDITDNLYNKKSNTDKQPSPDNFVNGTTPSNILKTQPANEKTEITTKTN